MNVREETNYIIIHCSASPDRGTKDWPGIKKYHVEERGWSDVGYHYGVELIGENYFVVKGRKENYWGAHCIGRNHDSLGICMVGHFDKHIVPDEQWQKTIELCSEMCEKYKIPIENIHPHNKYANKSCPGNNVDMDKFRKDVAAELYGEEYFDSP